MGEGGQEKEAEEEEEMMEGEVKRKREREACWKQKLEPSTLKMEGGARSQGMLAVSKS